VLVKLILNQRVTVVLKATPFTCTEFLVYRVAVNVILYGCRKRKQQ